MKKIINNLKYSVPVSIILLAHTVQAQLLTPDATNRIVGRGDKFGAAAGFAANQSPGSIMAIIIEGFLGILGIIFLTLMIIAGYNWMTASGEEQKIEKAKSTIKRAMIGLAIVVAAYSITYFVFKALDSTMGAA